MIIYMLSGGTTYASVVVDKFASQAKSHRFDPRRRQTPWGCVRKASGVKKKKKKSKHA